MAKELAQIFVKPAVEGQIIRDEYRRRPYALDPNGEWKPRSIYWLRRIRQGDVVQCEPTKAAASKSESDQKSSSAKSKRTKKDEGPK